MKYEDGHIKINLHDLIDELAKTQRAEIIDALACQGEVINEVMNQVLDGRTTLNSSGSSSGGGNHEATHGIDGARMRIAKASSEIAAREIERLGEALKRSEAAQNKGWDAYHASMDSRRFP